jgi:hypothetical protein
MDFAICPTGGLPRLFRFDITDDRILSELDAEQNLLRINPYLFERLDEHLQKEVFKTQAKVLTVN